MVLFSYSMTGKILIIKEKRKSIYEIIYVTLKTHGNDTYQEEN